MLTQTKMNILSLVWSGFLLVSLESFTLLGIVKSWQLDRCTEVWFPSKLLLKQSILPGSHDSCPIIISPVAHFQRVQSDWCQYLGLLTPFVWTAGPNFPLDIAGRCLPGIYWAGFLLITLYLKQIYFPFSYLTQKHITNISFFITVSHVYCFSNMSMEIL